MRTEPAQRTINGQVSNLGAIITGTGFTSQHNSTGVYTLRFTPPLRSFGGGAVSVLSGSGAQATLANGAGDSVNIFTFNGAGAASDQGFTFMVTGIPR